jgi:hypothetical protein
MPARRGVDPRSGVIATFILLCHRASADARSDLRKRWPAGAGLGQSLSSASTVRSSPQMNASAARLSPMSALEGMALRIRSRRLVAEVAALPVTSEAGGRVPAPIPRPPAWAAASHQLPPA